MDSPVQRPAGRTAAASRAGAERKQIQVWGAVSFVGNLIAALPFMGDIRGNVLGHHLAATPLTITLVTVAVQP